MRRGTRSTAGSLRFNGGVERTGDFGPNWDESGARMYDPQLGRFHGVYLLAGVFPGITPVQFGANSPVVFNDPSGLAPTAKLGGTYCGQSSKARPRPASAQGLAPAHA